MIRPSLVRHVMGVGAAAACLLATASCGELARTGRGPAYLIIENVAAARGSSSGSATFTSSLLSDVLTLVEVTISGQTTRVPTIFNDLGQATIRAEMKNPLSLTEPSTLNSITLNRYRVVFRRTDGQNREGVDVPFSFDGGTTQTISVGTASEVNFDLVRHQAKSEPPLRNLINGGGLRFITVIAEVTFYGRDQAGNDVSVTGSIDVQFGDFGDE